MTFLEKNYKSIVVILLFALFIQAITSIKNKSITVDEISHLSSGYSYIKTWDFRLNVEALPLVDMISALPLLFLNPKLPLEHESWLLAKNFEYEGQYHWEFGNQFFFHYNNNPDQILFFGRIPVMLLSVLLGFFVFRWAKELYGIKAGLFALFLYSFSPEILAHSRLATIDLGSSFFIFIALYYFWRFLRNISIKSLIIAGITLGLAELSKFTALYIIPVYFILAFIFLYKHKENISLTGLLTHKKTYTLFWLLLIIFLIAFFVILAGFGFKGFPAYILGLTYVTWHSQIGHPVYLFGQHSMHGWWYYYIAAFLIKTPIAALIFIILSSIFFSKIRNKDIMNELFIAVPVIILIIFSFFNHINIGIRHILPIYPFIFVFVSKLVNLKVKKQRIFRIIILLLCLWYFVASIMIYPNYLAYFNELVGGPDNGYKYLLDSNLDWGQDLKGLKLWMDKNGINNISLGYWGKDNIELRGIKYRQVNCYPEPGLIAVSANTLYGLREERSYCLEWLRDYKPIDKIGYSIFIYNITDKIDVVKERELFCKKGCATGCAEVGLKYGRSYYANESCQCECK